MDKSILYEKNGMHFEDRLQTFSVEEQEKAKINKANASLVFSPKFIPFYPKLLKEGLTMTEIVIYGFIDFYISNCKNIFYFTNKQISEVCGCSTKTVKRSISKLKKYFHIRYKKTTNGTVRFINPQSKKQKVNKKRISGMDKMSGGGQNGTRGGQNGTRGGQNVPANNNNNKNNNINININKQKHGNKFINLLMDKFKSEFGFSPTDKKPRFHAYNLKRNIEKTYKVHKKDLTEQSFINHINVFFDWLKKQIYFEGIQTMDAVRRKYKMFADIIEERKNEKSK
jgi:hypothetical protein